jgi:uncharacterized protein YndB with AHSA1/START domain
MLSTKPSLILKRRIKAAPAKIYAAWTDPKEIVRWFGSDQGPTLHAETDLRVGGRFRIVFRTLDGETHDVSGTYLEVVSDRKLAFTWNWARPHERESLVMVDLKPDGDGTLLTLAHEQIVDDTVNDYRRGWVGALDKLAKLFADFTATGEHDA